MLATALVLQAGGQCVADEPADTGARPDWACSLCPTIQGWFGEWDFGMFHVSDTALKFGDFRGLEEDGGYYDLGGEVRFRSDSGYFMDLYGRDLGLDSRALELSGGHQGKYEFRAHYAEIPRYMGHGTQTPFSGVGTPNLELPSYWITSFTTAGMTRLEEALAATELASERKTAGAGLTLSMGSAWQYHVDFEQQTREGTRQFGSGIYLTSATLLPAPVDFTTDQFNMGLSYAGDRGQLRLELFGSEFDNGYNHTTWENPFAIFFGDEYLRAAQEPGNDAYQVNLSGAMLLAPRVRFSAKVGLGEMEQDDPFLPYSINPAFEGLPLPRDSLGGKIDVTVFNLSARLHARLGDRLNLSALFKTDERDNKTPVNLYTPILDDVARLDPVANVPYGFERTQANLEIRYRPKTRLRLNAGVREYRLDRSFQEVSESDETSFWGGLQFSPSAMASLRFKFETLDRDAVVNPDFEGFSRAVNPLLRKFNMAQRDRDRITAALDLAPSQQLGINLSYFSTEDDYHDSVIGLTSSEQTTYNIDVSYAAGDRGSIHAFVSRDEIDSGINGKEELTSLTWNARTEDSITTWGIGFSGKAGDKVTYGADYVESGSDGEILTLRDSDAPPFPVLKTDLRNARVYLRYAASDHWLLGFEAMQEEYDTEDWALDGIGPDGILTVLTMGEVSPDYQVQVYRARATYRF
jgi:MtrB/PioB family decaheme-associated outer membrane protein